MLAELWHLQAGQMTAKKDTGMLMFTPVFRVWHVSLSFCPSSIASTRSTRWTLLECSFFGSQSVTSPESLSCSYSDQLTKFSSTSKRRQWSHCLYGFSPGEKGPCDYRHLLVLVFLLCWHGNFNDLEWNILSWGGFDLLRKMFNVNQTKSLSCTWECFSKFLDLGRWKEDRF